MCFLPYHRPYWLTFKQVQEKGGSVRKGEKSSIVIFWQFRKVEEINKETGEPETKEIPFLRFYRVFNVLQTEGLEYPQPEAAEITDPIEAAQNLVLGFHDLPEIKHGFLKACYIPSEDLVKMPNQNSFICQAEYFSCLYHECVHATGNLKRLNRSTLTESHRFGSDTYAQEELVAEMGSAFLCGMSGISQATIENSAAYIKGWRDRIAQDPKLVVIAASQAQKAVTYLTGETDTLEEEQA